MKAFPLSLSKGTKEWWINEWNGNISTWEELVKNFFKKFYSLSCASNYDKMCNDDEEEIGKDEGLLNDEVSSDEEWEEHEYGNPPKTYSDETQIEQNLAEPRVESNVKFEFGKELLTELQSNTFSGMCEQDMIGHIGKVLEILDLVKIAGVDPFLTPHENLSSLTFEGRKRMMDERGRWEYYHLGRMCDDDDEGCDPLEFIPWMNSKFKDHKEVDETTKRALLHTWVEIGNEEGPMDEVSSDEE
ncbi:hypothetical protein Tco_0819379 [Tanacetum coccineum]|uniref:Uncharacterized protein n=1 Tax=Tanacetum coccineum TaxID=301880 RepID=A0ABQ5A6D5_9ASTR